ncbi:MAG: hypothetical protein AAF632_14175 [Bacteroidota bacterium]
MITGPLVDGNNMYLKYWSEPIAPDFSNAAELEFKVFVTDVNNPTQPTVIDEIPGVTNTTIQTTGPFIRDNLIYFPVNNAEFNGYYTIDRNTDEVQVAISAPGVVLQGILILQE